MEIVLDGTDLGTQHHMKSGQYLTPSDDHQTNGASPSRSKGKKKRGKKKQKRGKKRNFTDWGYAGSCAGCRGGGRKHTCPRVQRTESDESEEEEEDDEEEEEAEEEEQEDEEEEEEQSSSEEVELLPPKKMPKLPNRTTIKNGPLASPNPNEATDARPVIWPFFCSTACCCVSRSWRGSGSSIPLPFLKFDGRPGA